MAGRVLRRVAAVSAAFRRLRPAARTGLRRPGRRGVLLAVAAVCGLALVFAFYVWTAITNPEGFPYTMTAQAPRTLEQSDYFNLQADAFREGQVALLLKPHPALLALPDPYDPTRNEWAYRVHDLSLYQGRYYLYWGPTPVLTLFLPARLVLKPDLPEEIALTLYAFGGMLASIALFLTLARHFLPRARTWMLVVGVVTLAFANLVPHLLRQPTVYQVAIAAGFCFGMLGVLLLVTGVLSERIRWWRLAGGSLSIGVAANARPSAILCGVVALGVLVVLLRRPEVAGRRARALAALAVLGPIGLGAVGLLAYNQIRFDSITQFGLTLQMNAGTWAYRANRGLENLVPGLYYYVLAPARLSVDFPFFHVPPPSDYPGTLPPGYEIIPTLGILTNAPILLLGLVGIPAALRSRTPARRRLGWAMLAVASVGAVLLLFDAGALWGVSLRYSVDFAGFFLVASLLAWLSLAEAARAVALRRLVVAGGACLAAYSVAVGIAISFTGPLDSLRQDRPATYDRIERAFTPVSVGVTALRGEPAVTEILLPHLVAGRPRHYALVPHDGLVFPVGTEATLVEVVAPGRRRAVLRAEVAPAGGHAIEVTDETDRRTRAQPQAGRLEVPVALKRGINRIAIRRSAAGEPLAFSALRVGL